MKEQKSYEEILEFAVFKERQANRFYLAMAERVGDRTIGRIFEELAAEELEHKAKVELELMKAGRVVKPSVEEPIDSSEYVLSKEATLDMDLDDVLGLAIAKEEAAFELYVELVAQAEDAESRDALLALAAEEVKHKLRFEAERDRLGRRK